MVEWFSSYATVSELHVHQLHEPEQDWWNYNGFTKTFDLLISLDGKNHGPLLWSL